MKTSGSVIVSWDFSNGDDSAIMLVGVKKPGKPAEVINAFQGSDAIDLYEKLTTRKETANG